MTATATGASRASPDAKVYPHAGDAVADARDPRADAMVSKIEPDRVPEGYPAPGSVPVCVLVPVKNEQANIVECLRRLQWCEQITVVDSQSSDDTIPLAQAMGGEVYQFHYDRSTGWPKKKNWALEHVRWRNEWILIVDADEHVTPELAREIESVLVNGKVPETPGCGDGYWLNRRFMFLGRWLKYGGWYPSWNLRLFKHRIARYERIGTLGDTGSGDNEVHEHPVLLTGQAGYLKHDMKHYAYPDLSVWIEKHNRYTTWEAHAWDVQDEGGVQPRLFGGMIERRRWLKKHARGLPGRPFIRFFFDYFVRRGMLDGYAGFVMAINMAWYEFMSDAKRHEMKHAKRSAQSETSEGGR
ncbi:MAG: glycosyltransferase family 2 protein [Phycisphaerales bacterium]|nr:glycosyltransferase family 2 protein [Phycisphaerales bacterium]